MNFQSLTKDDVVPWAALLADSFGRDPADMRHLLEWFHMSGMLAWGAWDRDRLVAQYSCLLRQLRVPWHDEPLLVGMSVNMAVHPDYRGLGLVKHVARPVYEALHEIGGVAGVGFSNAEGVKVDKRSKGYGYRVMGRMQSKWVRLSRRVGTAVPLTLTNNYPEDLAVIPVIKPALIQFDTTAKSMHFRFAKHPFRRYRFGVWQEYGETLGVVVFRPIQVNHFTGVSLLAAYGHDLPELLRRWALAIGREGITFVHLLATPRSTLLSAIKPLGMCVTNPFMRSPYYLTVKPLIPTLPRKFGDFSLWDCSGGDIL